MRKYYFNAKKKRKDPRVESEKRRLNNEAIKKSISRRGNKKYDS
jgi:hypothetical protein